MAGANIDYSMDAQVLWRDALAKIIDLMEVSGSKTAQKRGIKDMTSLHKKICAKVSATAPTTDDTDDRPNALGDICVHYNTSGVLQNVYVCTEWSETGVNNTWTVLSKGAEA